MAIVTKQFRAKGMHCHSCEKAIERSISSIAGIKKIHADYATETGEVSFDSEKTDIHEIFKAIGKRGYECSLAGPDSNNNNNNWDNNSKQRDNNKQDTKHTNLHSNQYYNLDARLLGIIFGIVGILVISYFAFRMSDNIALPQISQNMGYGLLFLVGLLTGFHCVSMCGGFVVSYTAKHAQEGTKAHKSHLMYAAGKTISYTVIGAVFGLFGSIIAFTPAMRGISGIIAGVFLVFFGLRMLNIFSVLRKIQFRTPAPISRFVDKEQKNNSSPLLIGLLNGLMIACGPLQAIYIMAAGTGSMLEGAKLLFVFALGTLPVMLGFGFLTSVISAKATHKILKASGIIVILLGLMMVNRGLALTGAGYDTKSLFASFSVQNKNSADTQDIQGGYQIIRMDVTKYGWQPNQFVLKKGVPVKWVINGKELTRCNSAIQVPKLGLRFEIKPGEQVIEFTPTEEGVISWSCWMGMIPGTFIVKENADINQQQLQGESAAITQQQEQQQQKQQGSSCGAGGCGGSSGSGGGSCGAGGGGCGCGG